jgi:hypothetical protein
MANEKNLTHRLTVEEQREGGRKSVQSRRNKKTIQTILSEILDTKAGNVEQFGKLAAKIGIEKNKSIKEVYAIVCLLNSIKNADLSDLEKLTELLGENKLQNSWGVGDQQEDALSKALREEAERMEHGDQ